MVPPPSGTFVVTAEATSALRAIDAKDRTVITKNRGR
jgi:hypothetical protein